MRIERKEPLSKLRGIRFCDTCLKAIHRDDIYYENGKKDLCRKCNGKRTIKRTVVNAFLTVVFMAVVIFGYNNHTKEIVANKNNITHIAEYLLNFTEEMHAHIDGIGEWQKEAEYAIINVMYEKHSSHNHLFSIQIAQIREELSVIVNLRDSVRKELNSGEMTDTKVALLVKQLQSNVDLTNKKLEILLRNPKDVMEKMVNPTVAIIIRDKKRDHLNGSGVLFRKDIVVHPITGATINRYYGFTCYHVWKGVFEYLDLLENPPVPYITPNGLIIPADEIDKTLNPRLVIAYFGGQTTGPKVLFTDVKFIYPNKLRKQYRPIDDIAVFTFITVRDLSVAELASDAEIAKHVKYNSRMYTVGLAKHDVPTIYAGRTANPNLIKGDGIAFHTFGYFGQSGGPIFDGEMLKIISINQRISMHRSGFSSNPITSLMYGSLLNKIRIKWKLNAPAAYRDILTPGSAAPPEVLFSVKK